MNPLPENQPANEREKFCARCGTALAPRLDGGRLRAACAKCGNTVFGRFSLGVGGLLKHGDRVLVIRRGCEPGKGRWTLPGGYVEEDEPPHLAIEREVFEETGLKARATGLLLIRHSQGRENQNAYMVFGLMLEGPISDLKPFGDGIEVDRAEFIHPRDLSSLGDIGAVSRLAIERCDPAQPALPISDTSAMTLYPGQFWSQVYGQ